MLRHILSEFPASDPLPGPIMIVLLGRLRAILIRHLKLEDDYVYPALAQAPEEQLRNTARRFRVEMGGLMRAFEDFDERWPNGSADPQMRAQAMRCESVNTAQVPGVRCQCATRQPVP